MKLVTKIRITIFLFITAIIIYGYLYPSYAKKVVYNTCDLIFKENNTINNDILKDTIKICNNDSIEKKEKTIKIPLKKDESGLFYITSKINDVPIKFILDTGCSNIFLSQKDIDFLLNHDLISRQDNNGVAMASYANGEVELTQLYNIKELAITEDIKLNNLSCSVSINDEAQALLGQEALQKLGKIIIDYTNNELIIIK